MNDQHDDKKKIERLTYALGLALGALEVVNLSPYDFNKDGIVYVIKQLKLIMTEAVIIAGEEPK